MGAPKKIFGSVLGLGLCFLFLCVVFYLVQEAQALPPYLGGATTAFATALFGGVAAGIYLNLIGLRIPRNE